MFYELSSEDLGALSSDPACSSSVFITAGHFPLAVFFLAMREKKMHPEAGNIYYPALSIAIVKKM